VDHKRIGILYGLTAIFWFFVGGLEALLIRTQLATPNAHVVSAQLYNQLFTMHGTTMVFLVVMPLSSAFFNYLIPLQIGARDVAFPRMNAFSYWMFLAGGIFINASWFLGGAPDGGWFGYAPLTESAFSKGHAIDFWILGLQILGIASLIASLNFIVTIINMRAPGMSMMRLPVFTWMTLVVAFLVILAFPVITIALLELMFDRQFDTNFFTVAKGGMPILWQHLFWVFGHPEVYILILPAMGIVSEVVATFSRKPLFGYDVVVLSGAAIGFLGFGVWSHHMFATGLGQVATTAFSLTTMAIAVPTGVKILNWLGTMWGGQLRLRLPLLYSVAFIAMFMMGGFSGLMHASPPADAQQTDTYFIVAHFHYVLIGGALFGLLSGIYYWMPKITGRMPHERFGVVGFITLFVGMNTTFFPMHFLGLNGMPRRIYTYGDNMGFNHLNLTCTVGAYIMAVGILLITINIIDSVRTGAIAGNDPWDARTLEWSIPSPPPDYNFAEVPVVKGLDDLWLTKHPELLEGHGEHAADEAHGDEHHDSHGGHGIHMPGLSWYPLAASFSFLVAAFGWVFFYLPVAISFLLLGFFFVYCWALEGPGGYEIQPMLGEAGTSSHPETH
jgi:cytochrome c oxidase subunit I